MKMSSMLKYRKSKARKGKRKKGEFKGVWASGMRGLFKHSR